MPELNGLILAKSALVGALGVWIGIITINNATDPLTNTILMHRMFSMQGIDRAGELGAKLKWRAIDSRAFTVAMLYLVVLVEAVVAFLLMRGMVFLALAAFGLTEPSVAVCAATLGLSGFMCLFLFFLCGGVWFMYWLKMGELQSVHMNGLLVSIAALIFVNS